MTPTFDRAALIARLFVVEDVRLFPYVDTRGKVTIGVGRNLSDTGISPAEVRVLLDNDIDEHWAEMTTSLPWVRLLDPVRQAVLLELHFNLGDDGLRGFVKMLAALRAHNYQVAAAELLDSRAAQQTGPSRYPALAAMLITGRLQPPQGATT